MESLPFQICVPDEVLDDLQSRLRQTRRSSALSGQGWRRGTDLSVLEDVCHYWASGFDWRRQEQRLNELPQYLSEVNSLTTHYVHLRSPEPDAVPLVLTHGWPGTFAEFAYVADRLADPRAHGGLAGDAFHVVVPSIPGYGFSAAPRVPGFTIRDVGAHVVALMSGLGYDRFAAQGGDWGSMATHHMALDHPDRLLGIHLNLLMAYPPPGVTSGVDEPSTRAFERLAQMEATGGNLYWRLQGAKPHTLSPALSDSPAGLAAWIVEKFYSWCDHPGDLFEAISVDDFLTHLTIYWVTNTIGSSLELYFESVQSGQAAPPHTRVEVPTSVLMLPEELNVPTREWASVHYNVVRWTELAAGGHFAAMEQPDAFVEDVRTSFRACR